MPSPNLTPGEYSKPKPESIGFPNDLNLHHNLTEGPDAKKIKLSTPETTQNLLEAKNSPHDQTRFSSFNGPTLTQAPPVEAQACSGTQLYDTRSSSNPQYLAKLQFIPPTTQIGSLTTQLEPPNTYIGPSNTQTAPQTTAIGPYPQIGQSIQAANDQLNQSIPLFPPSSITVSSDAQTSEAPMTYAMKKQLERMEKQRQREIERLEREAKKEFERLAKKEERERKELERKLKREQLEKEKEQKREEERLKREEKRKKVEDERKRKEEERRKKELERKQKEDERKRKEEQKERSQMRISSFFAIKPEKKKNDTRSSLPAATAATATAAVVADTTKRTIEQYDKDFLPFFKKRNVLMACSGQLPEEQLLRAVADFDSGLKLGAKLELSQLAHPLLVTETILHTNSEQLVQALNSPLTTEKEIQQLVANLPPIKYLQFYENSKPPFVGTWCSLKHIGTAITPNNVLDTILTGFDYNYDSDLDWDGDDEDGEDIDELEDGEEEDEDIAEEEDMDDFVEDTGDGPRKRIQIGMIQSTTYWNDGSSTLPIFDDIKYERLDADIDFPIDPLKDYWKTSKTAAAATSAGAPQKEPLGLDQIGTPQKATTNTHASPNILTPQKPTIKEPEIIKKLMDFVEKNCDFSIGTLSELAKKEFKTYTKSILKHTIQEVAVYNKKKGVWEVKPEAKA